MTAVDIVMQHGMERLLLQGWGGDLLAYGLSHNMGAYWMRAALNRIITVIERKGF